MTRSLLLLAAATAWALLEACSAIAQPLIRPAASQIAQFEIRSGERLVGVPRVALEAGNPVVVAYEGTAGYSLRVTMSEVTIAGRQMAQFDTRILLEEDGVWAEAGRPTIAIPFGGSGSARIDRPNGRPPLALSVRLMGRPD